MKTIKDTGLDFLEEFSKFIKASQQGKRTKPNGSRILKASVRRMEITYLTLKKFIDIKQFLLIIKVLKKK